MLIPDFIAHGVLNLSAWQVLLVTLVLTHITIAAVTIFLHRCQAHRALELHAIPSHFFRFWLWMTTGMVTKQWAAIHRKHHAKCETEEDPHSPQTRGIKTVLLRGAELYRAEAKNQETMDRYGHGTPDDWIERNLYTKHSALGVSIMLILNVILFGPLGLTVWAVQMLWIPITAAGIINGLGHYVGYRNYDCPDASTNLLPWGIIIGGEELHNNHHTYAASAKLSNKWYEFDIGWLYIRIMAILGLATVKKVAPTPKLTSAKPVCDLDSLQAVLTYRYDLMTRYAHSLKAIYAAEIAKLRASAKFDKQVLASLNAWLHQDESQLEEGQRRTLSAVLADSPALQRWYEMKRELYALWARSSDNRDQLLQRLQAWCKKAEESNQHYLRDIALRLRQYAM
ncbi:acyl-CoA desaturase [Parvibium lacunae]|uniref:Acyl-CoA desaturase n=1 Tax=Parvibium lacunae TaxID=1888893 RepID=A0A368L4I2_9BURK|nr:fatty acid desaturase [Parvibium lacunae]RCS58484.1 acyl-CoA desaturase [Parvibium lacunae]